MGELLFLVLVAGSGVLGAVIGWILRSPHHEREELRREEAELSSVDDPP